MVNSVPLDFIAFTVPETHSYAIMSTEVTNNTFKLLSKLEQEGHIEGVRMSTKTLFETINDDMELDDLSEIKIHDKNRAMVGFSVVNEDMDAAIKSLSRKRTLGLSSFFN